MGVKDGRKALRTGSPRKCRIKNRILSTEDTVSGKNFHASPGASKMFRPSKFLVDRIEDISCWLTDS